MIVKMTKMALPHGYVIIKNRAGSVCLQQQIDHDIEKRLAGRQSVFLKATRTDKGAIVLGRRVKDECW